jgi:integrase
VIEEAENRDPRLAPLLMLAALTGMRRGELCALRWTDLDLTLGIVGVSRSVVVVPGGLAEKSTKTDRARKVALDAVGIALLTEYRAEVDEWAKKAGVKLAKGVDIRTVAERLGHTDPSLTLRVYAHVIEQRDRAAAEIMGQVLNPTKKAALLATVGPAELPAGAPAG